MRRVQPARGAGGDNAEGGGGRQSLHTDRAWLESTLPRLRAGEAKAFSDVFRAYLPLVHRYLARLMRHEDARDVAQQVFLDVWAHADRVALRPESFESWLFVIARHRALDIIRKRRWVDVTEPRTIDAMRERQSEPDAGQAYDLDGLIGDLSDLQREVLTLRYRFSLSTPAIGVAIGRSNDAVRQLERRGLAALRRAVPDQPVDRREALELSRFKPKARRTSQARANSDELRTPDADHIEHQLAGMKTSARPLASAGLAT